MSSPTWTKIWETLKSWFRCTPSMQWDMAANAMWVEGYTEFEIRLELGPRPKDEV